MALKVAMVRSYAHKGTTGGRLVKFDGWDEAAIGGVPRDEPGLGPCWIGRFLVGVGAFGVLFPVADTRPATRDERDRLKRGKYVSTFGLPPLKLREEDFWNGAQESKLGQDAGTEDAGDEHRGTR